ncbi:MAG: cytochrome c [Terracidiphilus sp.]|jgi:mono/diheme cytochrome c family protein
MTGRLLLGVLLGILLVPILLLTWLRFGKVPVAVTDPPLFQERLLTGIPLHARIHREMKKSPVITPDEAALVSGAHIYSEKCAVCHGYHGKPSQTGGFMYPAAPPLWEDHHHNGTIGVSDDPPGETYWKVANGIRLTGMPAYAGQLSEAEMWNVSLLLANADKPLPPQAVEILRGETAVVPAAEVTKIPALETK